jgi:hypothetical protein
MRTHPILRAAPLVAALFLVACGKPETIRADSTDDMQAELNAAKPVELPPAVSASKSFRCKDGSVAFIDFFTGNKQAILRVGKRDATPVTLKGDGTGPLTAEGGYSLTGDGTGPTVTLAEPGKPAQSCKA